MHMKRYFNVCKNLVWADLLEFKQVAVDKIIDTGIWVLLTVVVSGHIMPYFGLVNFGPFQFGGAIAAVSLFELYASTITLVGDLTGDRMINYSLTLPIPSVFALLSKSVYYFLTYTFITVFLFPLGYLCLWGQWHLMNISYLKLLLSILFQSMFYACFVLYAASLIENMGKLRVVWARFVFPMWYLGGFQFSWLSLYTAIPFLAYLNVINPMIYITESTRVALLGQEGYANFWLCLIAIATFSFLSLFFGIRNLKKRLDFV